MDPQKFQDTYPEISALIILMTALDAGFEETTVVSPDTVAAKIYGSIQDPDLVLVENALKIATTLPYKDFMAYIAMGADISEALAYTVDILIPLPERRALEKFVDTVWDCLEAIREAVALGNALPPCLRNQTLA